MEQQEEKKYYELDDDQRRQKRQEAWEKFRPTFKKIFIAPLLVIYYMFSEWNKKDKPE